MGLTIKSPLQEFDIGYFGFAMLRRMVAEYTMPEYIYKNYDEQLKTIWDKDYCKQKAQELDEFITNDKNYPKYRKAYEFLFISDGDGTAPYGMCKQILTLMGDKLPLPESDPNNATLKKLWLLRSLMRDCVNTKKSLKWD